MVIVQQKLGFPGDRIKALRYMGKQETRRKNKQEGTPREAF